MLEALWIVRQFPKQILRDLHRFHNGLKLADWWRGTRDADGELKLSSYELLVYLEFLDEESAFKTAAERGGRWPDWKQMLAESVNESYRMRSSYFAIHSEDGKAGFDTTGFEFIDPVERQARQRAIDAADEANAKAQAEFESALGY